ncbi:head-tail joining protein [Pseudomonas aeruginosa]|uniref:head-tail joining protein n=1 Tax=Pseudomonas aeruginosa TaxID=287 RepID=UPI0018C584EB|nr:hypothetical protein [Pseudomonas aeruginosa]MBG5628353.1 hypothetical protein [Pseudomonas aeruginosa]MBI8068330.1 hypothetical protein [Pseudomonas aeruginosa]
MGWANWRDRLHQTVMKTFADGRATHQSASGAPPSCGFEVIIDHNLMMTGPEGMFQTDKIGISWRKIDLPGASRGDVFIVGGQRFMVEEMVADDGHILTAVCRKDLC